MASQDYLKIINSYLTGRRPIQVIEFPIRLYIGFPCNRFPIPHDFMLHFTYFNYIELRNAKKKTYILPLKQH